MGIELLVRVMTGFGYSGIFMFIYMTILKFADVHATISEMWLATLFFMFVGLYFGVSSLIYAYEHWSLLKRTVIHFLLSVSVFYAIALSTGVFPLNFWTIFINLLIFVLIYAGIWLGHTLYYKKVIQDMNNAMK